MATLSKDKRTYPEPSTTPKPSPEAPVLSGDTQGLSDLADADSESVQELIAEGQAYEAAVVSGVENAPDADVAEVRTREVPEDDVPLEYIEGDRDIPREA